MDHLSEEKKDLLICEVIISLAKMVLEENGGHNIKFKEEKK